MELREPTLGAMGYMYHGIYVYICTYILYYVYIYMIMIMIMCIYDYVYVYVYVYDYVCIYIYTYDIRPTTIGFQLFAPTELDFEQPRIRQKYGVNQQLLCVNHPKVGKKPARN